MGTETHNLHLGSQKCHYASNYYAVEVLKSEAFVKKIGIMANIAKPASAPQSVHSQTQDKNDLSNLAQSYLIIRLKGKA
jgi:hypothetical protein